MAASTNSQQIIRPIPQLTQNLPLEIWDQIIQDYLEPDFDPRSQRSSPQTSFDFPWELAKTTQAFRQLYIRGLYQSLWIVLTVYTCGRPCILRGSQAQFNIVQRKLETSGALRFVQVNRDWLRGITQQQLSQIRISAHCCAASLQRPPSVVARFRSEEIINRSFTEFLNNVVLRFPSLEFDSRQVLGGRKRQARQFMSTVCNNLRNVVAHTFSHDLLNPNTSITNIVTMAQAQQIRDQVKDQGSPQIHSNLEPILAQQMRSAVGLMRNGVKQFMFLPEFLDTANRYRQFFRHFTAPGGHFPNDPLHQTLLSAIASHMAFICSALAQFLLYSKNTRELQRHYTMPNRVHDQWRFWSREQFWTPFLDDIDFVITPRPPNQISWFVSAQTNIQVWCTLFQAVAELSLAFARAALVVGDDDPDDPLDPDHDDVLPDIRIHTIDSEDPSIRLQARIEFRYQACGRHLRRSARMIRATADLHTVIRADLRAGLIQWIRYHDQISGQIDKVYQSMVFNDREHRARFREAVKQRNARAQNLWMRSKKARRLKRRLPTPRKKRHLKYVKNPCLAPILQPLSLVHYDLPAFIDPGQNALCQFVRWPDTGRPFRPSD